VGKSGRLSGKTEREGGSGMAVCRSINLRRVHPGIVFGSWPADACNPKASAVGGSLEVGC
jgi:hypothetical protein